MKRSLDMLAEESTTPVARQPQHAAGAARAGGGGGGGGGGDESSTQRGVVDDVLFKHDLLPKILSFVLDTTTYFNLVSVSRQWKQTMQGMEPPFLETMARLSLEHDENGIVIPKEAALPLFKQALVSLKDLDSMMYRQTKEEGIPLLPDGMPTFKKWPSLWPRNHVTLSYFFYVLCLQNEPHCHKALLYNVTKEYLLKLFQSNIQKCAQILVIPDHEGIDDNSSNNSNKTLDPIHQLEELVSIWRRLRGISKTVVGMTNYMDKFYVREQKLPTIQEIADHALFVALQESFSDATAWDKTTAEATSRLDIVMEQALKDISMEEGGTFLAHLPLLEKACIACETLRKVLERQAAAEPNDSFSATTSDIIIQICTRVAAAIRPVVDAMKKALEAIKKRGLDPDEL